jgi:uncharacterized protein YprB with RNaseH-like and TPR domain
VVDLDRLRQIVRAGPEPARRRESTADPVAGGHTGPDLGTMGAILGGQPIETEGGSCLLVERCYEAGRHHGRMRVADCVVEDGESLRLLDRRLPPARAAGPGEPRVVFLDLETTGLSGGAGTVAFLVGCGWFDNGAFKTRQFVLGSFVAERALLAAVADFIDPASLIVTYNGKTFDLPVMETRWLFHRMDPPFERKQHFDMLHPARRLWGGRRLTEGPAGDEGRCSLGALERRVVGFEREGDVAGFEIPSRYFGFLRTGDPRPLAAVLEHNRLDLVSLAAIVARATRLVRGGASACADAAESLAVGKVLDRANRPDAAAACYRRAAADRGAIARAEALSRLATLRRRQGRFAEAAEAWRLVAALEGAGPGLEALQARALEALAIHHEHRAGDLTAALACALEALDRDEQPRWRAALRHRLRRLDRKLARVHEKGGRTAAPLLRNSGPGRDQG